MYDRHPTTRSPRRSHLGRAAEAHTQDPNTRTTATQLSSGPRSADTHRPSTPGRRGANANANEAHKTRAARTQRGTFLARRRCTRLVLNVVPTPLHVFLLVHSPLLSFASSFNTKATTTTRHTELHVVRTSCNFERRVILNVV